ncbi:hypothetical protein [Streptomyces sp. NPDC018693]|uniref:hypothetical protein n=1 Tax=unclassified Streptomyces TaxID=2593676 RepID=UPI0037B7F7E0
MPSLPPPVWAELHYDGTWNDITDDVRVTTSPVTISRGLSSESASDAEPTSCRCALDSRDHQYAPRNTASGLYGKIGRNTPFRTGYTVGSPWAQLPGTAGNKLTTPDSPALAVTDLDLRVELAMEDWGAAAANIAGRYAISGNNRSWAIFISPSGDAGFLWSPDGTLTNRISRTSTEQVRFHNGQRAALRVTLDVDNGSGGYELRFYTGRTVDDEEWRLLGAPVIGGATTAVFDGSAGIEVGHVASLSEGGVNGKVFALKLLNGIAGTAVVSMAVAAGTPGATSFTGATGETWTVNGSATLTNKHIRMAGEVPAWPPTRDLSGNDNYVSINPTGITRRMDAGNKPQDSALLRYIKANGALESWPLTDGVESTEGRSLNGSQSMRVVLTSGTARPEWGNGRLADWIEPTVMLPAGSDGTMRGVTSRASSAGSGWSVDFFYSGKQDMDVLIADSSDGTDADPRIGWSIELDQSAGTISLFTTSRGDTTSSVTLQATINNAGVFDGAMHHIRLTTVVSGSDASWGVYVDGVLRAGGIATGYGSEPVLFVRVGWFYASVTTDLPTTGYYTYWGTIAPTAAEVYSAAFGFQGERAGTRIERLAAEAGFTATTAGPESAQERMGIQDRRTLLQLLNDANTTDFGYVLDARDRAEVIHRAHSTLENQPPGLTLDFSAGLISPPFRPLDDDLLTTNDVSVKRTYGAVPVRRVLESGRMSVQDPPDGVGRYDKPFEYSLYTDDQAADTAGWLLNLGTYDGVRYARLTLDLANERVFAMIDDILRLDVGDKIRLTNLPPDHGPDDVDILVHGYTEEAGPDAWKITFNCVPAAPWNVYTVASPTYGRLHTGGSELASDITSSATSMSVATTGLYRWADTATYPGHFPFDILVGGERMTVTDISGTTSPQTFTVTRSVNGAVLAHSAGDEVTLFQPTRVPL